MSRSSIVAEYKKARTNYLRRRRRLISKGYEIELIPIPKRVTEGSIRRLKKQTGAYMKKTAEKRERKQEKKRKQEQRTQSQRKTQQSQPASYIPQPQVTDVPDAAKIALERFREAINDMTPRIAAILRNFLKENGDSLDDIAIALMNNPELQPSPQDSERGVEYKIYLLQNVVDSGTSDELELASDVVYEEE